MGKGVCWEELSETYLADRSSFVAVYMPTNFLIKQVVSI